MGTQNNLTPRKGWGPVLAQGGGVAAVPSMGPLPAVVHFPVPVPMGQGLLAKTSSKRSITFGLWR